MLIGQEADDGDNPERLGGFDPALDFAHADRELAATRISGARGTVETVGKDGFHKCRRWAGTGQPPKFVLTTEEKPAS